MTGRSRERSSSRGRKAEPKSKSPARKSSKSKSPARKQPARSKSPARKSPARTKSPSRAKTPKKAPVEKSRSKSTERTASPERKSSKPPKSKPSVETISLEDSSDDASKEEIIRNSVSKFEEKLSEVTGVLRRSRRAVNANNSSLFSQNLERTETVNSFEKDTSGYSQSKVAKTITALLLIPVVPAVALISVYSCTKESCKPGNFKIPWKTWNKAFDLEVSLWYVGFFLLQMILTLMPFRKPITGFPFTHKPQMSVRCNGLISGLLTVGGIFLAKYLKFPLTSLLDQVSYLLIPSFAVGLLVALFIFFTTSGSKQKDSNVVNEFVFGRDPSPRLASLNFKMALMDFYVMSMLVYISVLVIAEIERKPNGQFSYSLLAACFLHLVLLLDFLVFQADVVTSYFIQAETMGYFGSVGFTMAPFITAVTPTYLFYSKGTDNMYLLAGTWFLFCAGLLLFRFANHQKASFRSKPNTFPSNTMVVTDREGRNLLASGLWGFVRHPNYLGCLLIYWSFVPLAWSHWAVYMAPVITTVEHLVRIQVVESHSKASHSSAWIHYTSLVPNKLIPRVY